MQPVTVTKHILRLYKQFAIFPHTSRVVDENGKIEMFYWKNADITSEDVVLETENEITQTIAQRRSMIYELLNSGLLHDENGMLKNSTRQKVLEQLGFGIWESGQDVQSLQIKRAETENLYLMEGKELSAPSEIDDHTLHINEHTCFMLGRDFEKMSASHSDKEEKMLEHIRQHKRMLIREKRLENIENKE